MRPFPVATLVLVLVGCSPPALSEDPTPTSLPTETQVFAIAPPSPATPPRTTTQPTQETVSDCRSQAGHVVESELEHPDLPRTIPFRVFIPPCVSEAQGRLPSLYLLHGLARTHAQWDDLGADELAQQLIATGAAPPFLIVMPWERKGLEYESAIVEFLVPHIEATYGASQESDFRSVGGISRGGGWALRLGLKHPEVFDAVGLHSPAVLVPDMFDIPVWVEGLQQGDLPQLWIDIGHRDTLRFEANELADLLTDLGVNFVRHTYLGEHTDKYWSDHLEDYLGWYISGWEVGT